MRTIRASEINAFLYCQRAWSYQVQGEESSSQLELEAGRKLHAGHYRSVARIGCTRIMAYLLMLLAMILLTIIFTNRFLV
jgi:hypothetical protein